MPTDVVMPQMGESIFEGTITKWLKKQGDTVDKDEPLFEISTDKVDAEIPSPAAGVLTEIRAAEGETVEINKVVAIIADSATAKVPQQTKSPAPTSANTQPDAKEQKPSSASAQQGAPRAQSAPPPVAQVDVVMPQMGESIFEGTITKWLKKTGDMIQKDEPLFEISTDKVDAEIPSPAAGVLTEIKVPEGATVVINAVVAVIGGQPKQAQPDGVPEAVSEVGVGAQPATRQVPTPSAPSELALKAQSAPPQVAQVAPPQVVQVAQVGGRLRSSPLVRKIAKEHQLDLARIPGTGSAGRITKDDVLQFLATCASTVPQTPATTPPPATSQGPTAQLAPPQVAQGVQGVQPMSRMRAIIAQRMLESSQSIPHAYSVYKIDMTRIVRLREREKAGYEQRHGVKLTYMPFIAAAAIDALQKFPIVNASIEGTSIRYHENIHIGIAVALEWGLIVPVIRQAEERSFLGLSRAIVDLAARARTKKLKPDEASGSTFTLTNSGIFGGEFGTPIINAPESAILAIGGLAKEPVVLTDAEGNDTIGIRSMQQFCLGFDHRTIDGADAGRFMTAFKHTLETWDRELG